MLKINFLPLWHPQTSVPATRAQVTLSFDWLAFAVKLVRWPRTRFFRECQPIKWECYKFYRECQPNQIRVLQVLPRMPANCYLCTRSRHGSLRVSRGKKIDFYYRGNWFLPPWKIFFFFLWKIFSIPLISSNKFTQVATALLGLWNCISSSSNKFIQVQPCHHRWPASVSWGLPAEEHESSWNWFFTTVEIDFTTMEVDSYNLGKLFFFLMEMNPSLKHSTGK